MRIYFLGICGTAMGQAALLARAAGQEVTGSDVGAYPPMSDVLARAGIPVLPGYDAARLEQIRPDLVVVGNAQSRGNPEIEWLLETRAFRFTSLPALLSDTVLTGRRTIVICGTHGKTTTTALAAFLLRENERDPGFLIGGVPLDPPIGAHLGNVEDPFVIEGDEYDSAFFDKRPKFIHYQPHIAVLNNLEFDHADIFRDLADVQRAFLHLTRIVPRNGWIVMNGDDENLRALGPLPWTRVVRVGVGGGNDVRIDGFSESAAGASFRLEWGGAAWAEVRWPLPGIFNARNAAMAATAVQLGLHPPAQNLEQEGFVAGPLEAGGSIRLESLRRFRGVRRRMEILAQRPGLTVIEDFGHHPTAVTETLSSLRARHPGSVLTAVFEPRSNTARTRALQDEFIAAFARADEVFLGAVNRAEKVVADERFDGGTVASRLAERGIAAHPAPTNQELLEQLQAGTLPADAARPRVVVFFTNGSFDGIMAAYASAASTEWRS